MIGEWRVTSNNINGKKMFAVFRIQDTSQPDHSGNRLYASGYMESRESAEALADQLNAEERDKAILDYIGAVDAHLNKLIDGEYETPDEIIDATDGLMKKKERLLAELGVSNED